MAGPYKGKILVTIAVVDGLLVVVGSIVTFKFKLADMPLATAFSIATVTTLFGLIHYANGRSTHRFGFREALAASIFTLYLLVVSQVIFFRNGQRLPPLGQAMLENFGTLTTVVAGFYFGGKAIEGAAGAILDRRERAATHGTEQTTTPEAPKSDKAAEEEF